MIQVDGGITADNAQKVVDAGADVLVAASYIFHHDNPLEAIRNLRNV